MHRAAQERPLRADAEPDLRERRDDLLGHDPVGREIVLAAQPVVVHPRDMRHAGIDRHALAFGLEPAHHPGPSLRLTS